uniref:DNA (Cytosine-5)-methyltransferase CMT2 n=1 Tax=Tanacetum cinerariifolium TaxID=118510 RepID=A0A6L2L924_TANCI|nr:DNA (cytosine-5)-methyltransferase CMT2 [Tanacetum cinerariifolium]
MDFNNFKVNGTEPDALTLTLHSLFDTDDDDDDNDDENDNDDELPVPLTVVKPSLVNGQSVRVDELSSNCEEERLSTPVKVRTESAENVGRKDKDKDKHKDREVGEERKLRRSPRLSTPATATAKNSVGRNVGKMLALCADEGNKVNGSVRRSPRLSTPVIVPEPETKRKKKEMSEVKRKSSGKVVSEKKKARLSSGSGSDVCFSGEESRVLELEYRGEVKPHKKQKVERERECCFVGEAVSEAEAMEKWAWRYELKAKRRKGQGWILNAGEEDEVHLNVECHYLQADVGGCIFSLGDCVHIKD